MTLSTPEIRITPPTQSPSAESFETASPNNTAWELTPYRFKASHLLATTPIGLDQKETVSLRLPEYNLLVDHTLGVVWKSFCNERKDIGQMSPQQLIWAIKVIESHRGHLSPHSDDMQAVIQYLQEIILAMSVTGLHTSVDPNRNTKDLSQFSETAASPENSFVLANMTHQKTPLATSTPLRIRSPDSTLQADRTGNELVKSLKSLQGMLVNWKKRQMRWIKINIEQLEAIERMLKSTAATGEDENRGDQDLHVSKSTVRNDPSKGSTENAKSTNTTENRNRRRSSLNC